MGVMSLLSGATYILDKSRGPVSSFYIISRLSPSFCVLCCENFLIAVLTGNVDAVKSSNATDVSDLFHAMMFTVGNYV